MKLKFMIHSLNANQCWIILLDNIERMGGTFIATQAKCVGVKELCDACTRELGCLNHKVIYLNTFAEGDWETHDYGIWYVTLKYYHQAMLILV